MSASSSSATSEALQALIAKLEAAKEGSSDLDWWVYLLAADHGQNAYVSENLILPWDRWIENNPVLLRLPDRYSHGPFAYTRSIDAALTLVPEKRHWVIESAPDETAATVYLNWEADEHDKYSAFCRTAPIALCAAASLAPLQSLRVLNDARFSQSHKLSALLPICAARLTRLIAGYVQGASSLIHARQLQALQHRLSDRSMPHWPSRWLRLSRTRQPSEREMRMSGRKVVRPCLQLVRRI